MDKRYTVQALESMTKAEIKAMRAEYTRMRDIAQKRIKRLGESRFSSSKAFQNYQYGFPKLKDIPKGHFAEAFNLLAKYVSVKSTTVSGQREQMKRTIATWNEMGIPLSEKNYKQVFDILKALRKQKKIYDSEKVVDAAMALMARKDIKISKLLKSPHLGQIVENAGKIASLDQLPKGQYYGIRQLGKELGW